MSAVRATVSVIAARAARGFVRGVLCCGVCAYKQSKIVNTLAGSLLFTLVTAFRKVVRYPEKVCFVPFHFDLREVEALLAKMASERKSNKKSRLQRCCGVGNKNERVSVGN